MTDHDDEIASAYLDGQATAEEGARIEGDPALVARVDELRSVSRRLSAEPEPVDSVIRRRHLAAALAAFDELAPAAPSLPSAPSGPSEEGGDNDEAAVRVDDGAAAVGENAAPTPGESTGAEVIDLSASRERHRHDGARPAARVTGHGQSAATGSHRRRVRRGVPGWLGAAAAAIVVTGGGIWFAAGNQGSSDSSETAAVESAAQDEAGSVDELTTDSDAAAESPREGDDSAPTADASGAVATDRADATALAESEVGAGDEDEDATPSTSASSAATTSPVPAGTVTVASFEDVPTQEELVERRATVALLPPAQSACAGRLSAPGGNDLSGFFRVDVAGRPGEALFYQSRSGGEATVVLVTEQCTGYGS